MAIEFRLTIAQVNGTDGDYVPENTLGGAVFLRHSADNFASNIYTGTFIDDGVYNFGTIVDEFYQVFVGGVQLVNFGTIKWGSPEAVKLTGAQTIADVKTFSSQPVLSAGAKTDTISENTPNSGVTIDTILLKDDLDTSNIVNKTTAQTVGGVKDFTAGVKSDTISESNAGYGVTIDGILLKDSLDTSSIVTVNTTQTITGTKTINDLRVPTQTATYSVLDRGQSDARYIMKEVGVTAQQVYSDIIFRELPFWVDDPTHAKYAANMLYVQNYCTALLAEINPSAYQQSNNEIRVIPDGVQETDKVYRTLATAITNAEAFAAVDRVMYVTVQGNGIGSTLTDYSLLPVGTAEPYIHIIGIGEAIQIRVAEDLYDGTAGQNVYSNLIFDNEAEDANTDFTNKIFYHCKFSNTFGSGTPIYDFIGCVFVGCTITTGYTFDATCKGELYDLTNSTKLLVGGLTVATYEIIESTGYVRPRRLQGRQGSDIASASSITLGEGNFFSISGTTEISQISSVGWEDGSVVHLYFQGALNLDTGGGNIARAGGDFAVSAGMVVSFLMDSASWIIKEN